MHLTQTYISLSTVNRTVSLINKYSVPLHYCWKAASSIQEEALDFIRSVCTETRRTVGPSVQQQRTSLPQKKIYNKTRRRRDCHLYLVIFAFCSALFFFLRKSSELQQQEEQMKDGVPAETHSLSSLPGAPQACRCPAVDQLRLSFSQGCITVEPAVGVGVAAAA